MEVKLNDYLDIVCPHYPEGEVPLLDAERYVLYMVEREDYESCKPQSYDQMRWECGHPFAPHAPEKFSEKFQRFTPFTLGKEFRQGESYYYICKCHFGFLSDLWLCLPGGLVVQEFTVTLAALSWCQLSNMPGRQC